MGRFDGQIVIVTGAGQGIGAAIASRFAHEGARVAVADRNPDTAASVAASISAAAGSGGAGSGGAGGGGARPFVVDMLDIAAVRAMVDAVVDWGGGRLDVLVNNAGVALARSLLDATEEDWDVQVGINLKGLYFALQAAARVMVAAGRGKIVNICSTSGYVSSSTPEAIYDLTKGGVRQLTTSAAVELAPLGVHVNAVAPGTVGTELTRSVLDTPEKWARAGERIPCGRLGMPEDIAAAVAWLASADAAYVYGHTLVVDGGWLAI